MAKGKAAAQTAAEIKEKYGRKRFSSGTAGLCPLIEFIYRNSQLNEGKPRDQLEYLYQNNASSKVEGEIDALRYQTYVNLINWIVSAMETSVSVRNSLMFLQSSYYQTIRTIIAGENLRQNLGEKALDTNVWIWLYPLTLQGYTPQEESYHRIIKKRAFMESSYRYMNAYNTFIELIGEAFNVPEITLFKVDMYQVTDAIPVINEALSYIQDGIADLRNEEAIPDKRGHITPENIDKFTPEYLAETLKAFAPLMETLEPIPEANLSKVKNALSSFGRSENFINWITLFTDMTRGYWRR